MIYFLFGKRLKVKVKVDPEVKVMSRPLRSWIELGGGSSRISVNAGTQCHNGASLDSLSQFDRKLRTKNADYPKGLL